MIFDIEYYQYSTVHLSYGILQGIHLWIQIYLSEIKFNYSSFKFLDVVVVFVHVFAAYLKLDM